MPKNEVIYLQNLEGIDTEGCDVYSSNGVIRTIVTPNRKTIKNLSGFRGDKELALQCKMIWDEMGYSGSPSSPASFFRQEMMHDSKTYSSHNFLLRKFSHGAWAEAFTSGSVLGNLYRYDLIKAYLWGGSIGLPSNIKCYKEGDKNFIGIFKIKEVREDLPSFFRKKKFLATSEDVEAYNLEGQILAGYSWEDLDFFPLMKIYKYQDYLPAKAYKLLTQSYWGVWHSMNPLKVKYRSGKKRLQYNYAQNLIWSNLIIHRIMIKVWEQAVVDGVLVQTDSVITKRKIKESDLIGGWELKKEYRNGLFVKSANIYTPINEFSNDIRQWEKHAGYRSSDHI